MYRNPEQTPNHAFLHIQYNRSVAGRLIQAIQEARNCFLNKYVSKTIALCNSNNVTEKKATRSPFLFSPPLFPFLSPFPQSFQMIRQPW